MANAKEAATVVQRLEQRLADIETELVGLADRERVITSEIGGALAGNGKAEKRLADLGAERDRIQHRAAALRQDREAAKTALRQAWRETVEAEFTPQAEALTEHLTHAAQVIEERTRALAEAAQEFEAIDKEALALRQTILAAVGRHGGEIPVPHVDGLFTGQLFEHARSAKRVIETMEAVRQRAKEPRYLPPPKGRPFTTEDVKRGRLQIGATSHGTEAISRIFRRPGGGKADS